MTNEVKSGTLKGEISEFDEDADSFFESLLQEAGVSPATLGLHSGEDDANSSPPAANTGDAAEAAGGDPPADSKVASRTTTVTTTTTNNNNDNNNSNNNNTNNHKVASTESVRHENLSEPVTEGPSDGDNDDALHAKQLRAVLVDLESPEPSDDFTAEDLALREVLVDFYGARNPARLADVTDIVCKYRGKGVLQLWVQLAEKYSLSPVQVIDLTARSLYASTLFECDEEAPRQTGQEPTEAVLRSALDASSGDVTTLRMLVCRGVSHDSLRPMCWKVLLGYLPFERRSEWTAILAEKRTAYENFKNELLVIDECGVSLQQISGDLTEMRKVNLLEAIREEVERTAHCLELLQMRNTLVALLFVYAELNPEVGYVQGMSEIGAVMLHVMMQEAEHAEADAFWCFNALMAEVKIRFLLDPGRRTADLQALLGTKCPSLLSKYDPELAKHFEECDLEPGVVALRWYMQLLAGAAAVPDVIRWWDAFFADARRFELCDYACLALVMEHREELLRTRNVVTLAEILQFVPLEKGNFEPMVRKAWAICALQRRVQSPPYPPLSTAVAVQEMAGAFFTGLFKNF